MYLLLNCIQFITNIKTFSHHNLENWKKYDLGNIYHKVSLSKDFIEINNN